jgi:hypothetical protein
MADYRKGYKVNPETGLTEAEERAGLTREEAEAQAGAEARVGAETRTSAPTQAPSASPKKKGGHKKAWILGSVGALLLLIILVAALGGGDKGSDSASPGNPTTQAAPPPPPPPPPPSQPSDGPLVRGAWNPECNQFSAGDEDACHALRVTKVTCQWQDDHVHMTVVFRNKFNAHVTVHMNPIYKLRNAGLHGNGLTSVEDVGLDAGEVRIFETDQDPAGVSGKPAITLCRPGVDTISGVELG